MLLILYLFAARPTDADTCPQVPDVAVELAENLQHTITLPTDNCLQYAANSQLNNVVTMLCDMLNNPSYSDSRKAILYTILVMFMGSYFQYYLISNGLLDKSAKTLLRIAVLILSCIPIGINEYKRLLNKKALDDLKRDLKIASTLEKMEQGPGKQQ